MAKRSESETFVAGAMMRAWLEPDETHEIDDVLLVRFDSIAEEWLVEVKGVLSFGGSDWHKMIDDVVYEMGKLAE